MVGIKEKIDLLSRIKLLKPCSKEVIAQIAEFSSLCKVSKGQCVFMNGEEGDHLYFVKSGEIAIIQRTEDHQEREIARYNEEDFFGEVDLLMNTLRNAEAQAAQDSEILYFPKEDRTLQDFLLAYPLAGAMLLHLFMQITSSRIRRTNTLLKTNSPWVQEMRNQVYIDKLTGLKSKIFLEEQLPVYLGNTDKPASLLMIKADNLKYINDDLGHGAGDQVLVAIGSALPKYVPDSAIVALFKSNEFACLLPDTKKEMALELAQNIQRNLNMLDLSAITEDRPFKLSVSIGIAVFPDHAKTAEDLITRAGELPLLGRKLGGNKILFPEPAAEAKGRGSPPEDN